MKRRKLTARQCQPKRPSLFLRWIVFRFRSSFRWCSPRLPAPQQRGERAQTSIAFYVFGGLYRVLRFLRVAVAKVERTQSECLSPASLRGTPPEPQAFAWLDQDLMDQKMPTCN